MLINPSMWSGRPRAIRGPHGAGQGRMDGAGPAGHGRRATAGGPSRPGRAGPQGGGQQGGQQGSGAQASQDRLRQALGCRRGKGAGRASRAFQGLSGWPQAGRQ